MDEVLKALADPSRRKLLDELHKNNGQTLSELCEQLDTTRQAVAKHLAVLKRASLVAIVWRGREKLHYRNHVPLQEFISVGLANTSAVVCKALSELEKHLENENQSVQTKNRLRHLHRHHAGKSLARADQR